MKPQVYLGLATLLASIPVSVILLIHWLAEGLLIYQQSKLSILIFVLLASTALGLRVVARPLITVIIRRLFGDKRTVSLQLHFQYLTNNIETLCLGLLVLAIFENGFLALAILSGGLLSNVPAMTQFKVSLSMTEILILEKKQNLKPLTLVFGMVPGGLSMASFGVAGILSTNPLGAISEQYFFIGAILLHRLIDICLNPLSISLSRSKEKISEATSSSNETRRPFPIRRSTRVLFLYLPGLGGNFLGQNISKLVETRRQQIPDADHHILQIDYRGSKNSSIAKNTFETVILDIAYEISGREKVCLVGASGGGLVAALASRIFLHAEIIAVGSSEVLPQRLMNILDDGKLAPAAQSTLGVLNRGLLIIDGASSNPPSNASLRASDGPRQLEKRLDAPFIFETDGLCQLQKKLMDLGRDY